ncbi:MAG: nucleotide sugar synthetase, partial [Liquorilactobacillus nagelii]
ISNQKIIEDNKLGLVVNDLNEAVIKVKSLSSKDYQEYIEHTIHFAELLRNGFFTKKLLIETVHCLLRKD